MTAGEAAASAGKVAIVVAHGSLARGLLSAMEKVLGPQPNVFWLSNTGKTPAALQTEIERLIAAQARGKDVYLLTDLRGGSCATTCLRSARSAGVCGVLYGVNLTLVLEFVLHQTLPAAEFLETLLAKARRSVDGVLVRPGLPDSGADSTAGHPHTGQDGRARPEGESERGPGAGERAPAAEPA